MWSKVKNACYKNLGQPVSSNALPSDSCLRTQKHLNHLNHLSIRSSACDLSQSVLTMQQCSLSDIARSTFLKQLFFSLTQQFNHQRCIIPFDFAVRAVCATEVGRNPPSLGKLESLGTWRYKNEHTIETLTKTTLVAALPTETSAKVVGRKYLRPAYLARGFVWAVSQVSSDHTCCDLIPSTMSGCRKCHTLIV